MPGRFHGIKLKAEFPYKPGSVYLTPFGFTKFDPGGIGSPIINKNRLHRFVHCYADGCRCNNCRLCKNDKHKWMMRNRHKNTPPVTTYRSQRFTV